MIKSFGFARRAAEKLYDSKADVWAFVDDTTNESVFAEEKLKPERIHESVPCRVSQKSIGAADGGNISYETKLFISPDVTIPAGSRLEVTDPHGNVDKYVLSGDSFDSYITHQEITLKKDEKS